MEEAAEETCHLVNNCSSLLANPCYGSNNDDVIVAEPPTEMGERAIASDHDADQNVGLDADIGVQGPNWVRRELSSEERVLAYQMLLEMSQNGKLKKNTTGLVTDRFHANIRLIQCLWKRGKASGNHNVSLKRVMNCGSKRIEFDLQRFKEIPLRQRGTLRSSADALGVSKTFLMSKLKSGELRRHSSHVKPTLTETNRMDRIKHCLSMLDPEAPPAAPSFVQMENVIHIEEKWFQMTKKKQTYYLLPDEDDPVRHCKSSNFIPKIMFLAAVARPRYDHNGHCTFDGRIGVFPLVTEVAAVRSSANRVAGTLELKSILKVNRNIIRQYMIDYVLPAIRDKWPHDSIREPIIIQQDNAKTHIHENDIEFLAAIHNVGLHIRLRCQPPNSPDLNVLDLGFLEQYSHCKRKSVLRM